MISTRQTIVILLILHLVGAVGIVVFDSTLIKSLSALNLLVSAVMIYPKKTNPVYWWLFGGAFSIGMAVEILGVATGFPFGDYWYGSNLGPKLVGVPLIIGVNWWLLAYSSVQMSKLLQKSKWLKISVAALIMLVLDILIEQVAPTIDYWHWKSGAIPTVNYVAWFVVGWFLCFGLYEFGHKSTNFKAVALINIQFTFFLLLYLFS